jgi:membrane-bound lytic murein transglycosylase B
MKIIRNLIIFFILLFCTSVHSDDHSFGDWLKSFKKTALKNDISEKTFNKAMSNVKFLPKVIEYDRFQPEFYEDTITYITKRSSKKKIKKGINFYLKNKVLINSIDKKFLVEKELLLSLMAIETNYGTYVGKMDILSSLATLSFDKRRSDFFTNELITLLQLVQKGIIDHKILYGSWAGAFGNFQFMPTTIKKYAIDYNSNEIIELHNLEDSFASAANYINKIGWEKNKPCFVKIELYGNIPMKFLNTSAKNIKNKKKLSYFKKYIIDFEKLDINKNLTTAIITPDKEIVQNTNKLSPAYLVFDNYELILKWNRSLRFALAVCTLKDQFTNEL